VWGEKARQQEGQKTGCPGVKKPLQRSADRAFKGEKKKDKRTESKEKGGRWWVVNGSVSTRRKAKRGDLHEKKRRGVKQRKKNGVGRKKTWPPLDVPNAVPGKKNGEKRKGRNFEQAPGTGREKVKGERLP